MNMTGRKKKILQRQICRHMAEYLARAPENAVAIALSYTDKYTHTLTHAELQDLEHTLSVSLLRVWADKESKPPNDHNSLKQAIPTRDNHAPGRPSPCT